MRKLYVIAALVLATSAYAAVRYVRATGDQMTGRLTIDVSNAAAVHPNALVMGAGDAINFGQNASFPGGAIFGGTSWGNTGVQQINFWEGAGFRSVGAATASLPPPGINSAGLLMRSTTDDYPYWLTPTTTNQLAYFADIGVAVTAAKQQFLAGYSSLNTDNVIFAASAWHGTSCAKVYVSCNIVVIGTVGGANLTVELYDSTTATAKGNFTFDCASAVGTVQSNTINIVSYTIDDVMSLRARGCTNKPSFSCNALCTP